LRTPDGTLLDEPLAERRRALDALAERLGLVRAPDELRSFPEGPGLLVAPWSRDDALADRWFADDAGIGQDGVVAKREDQPYLPGERGWVKIKHRRTVDCVVGGYRLSKAGDGVGSLLLGLYDPEGALHYVGHTSSFRAAERRELLAELEPLRTDESFAGGRTPGGPSRWSGGRDLEWVTIAPSRVCGCRSTGSRAAGSGTPRRSSDGARIASRARAGSSSSTRVPIGPRGRATASPCSGGRRPPR
jgi:ATP-dependent DNA ligase